MAIQPSTRWVFQSASPDCSVSSSAERVVAALGRALTAEATERATYLGVSKVLQRTG